MEVLSQNFPDLQEKNTQASAATASVLVESRNRHRQHNITLTSLVNLRVVVKLNI
jgi:serine protease inhibitor